MVHIVTIIDPREITRQFAKAVQNKDFTIIENLLADDGEFNTQDADLNTIESCSKSAFMVWLKFVLKKQSVASIEYDQCIMCRMGNPVVLFNDGFLIRQEDSRERAKTGFMIDVVDGVIKEIAFCHYFADRENKSQLEYDSIEIKKLQATGIPLLQAIDIVLAKRGVEDIWMGNKLF
ncbi:MAG: hypothetical protein K9G49_09190 [Taibaiella sp.]|nr:hypothetical protein [Taibaiella sp.]